jgi:hypothetical protein
MLAKMVKEGKGCNIRVERLGIVKVANPCVIHNSLNEDLDTALGGLISLVVLNQGGQGCFGTNVINARSFCIDVRVIACRTGGWAYKEGAVMVKIPVCAGNKSPEVVDTVDVVVGDLEKDRQDGLGETDKVIIGGLSIDGEKVAWAAARAKVIALGVMVAGWENWGGLPF